MTDSHRAQRIVSLYGDEPSPVRRRRSIAPRVNTITVTLAFVALTAVGLLVATKQQEANVERVGELNGMLTDTSGPFVNYLLVGSDTREGSTRAAPIIRASGTRTTPAVNAATP